MNMDLSMTTPAGFHAHLQPWSLPLPLTSALVLVALVYLRGWGRLRNNSPHLISLWRVAAFMGSLFLLWIVVGSPLSALDHELLTIHMINHLVLMTVAAPLMLAGAPGLVLLQGIPARLGYGLHDLVLRSASLRRIGRLLRHPVFCWLCAAATVIGWHLPAVFQLAMRSHRWHQAEYASFIVAGLLFGSRSSGRFQIRANTFNGPRLYISFLRLYLAISFPLFWYFAAASYTGLICPRLDFSTCQRCRISSVPVR